MALLLSGEELLCFLAEPEGYALSSRVWYAVNADAALVAARSAHTTFGNVTVVLC